MPDPTCPLCGSPMFWRRGRYGDFYGCAKYPACRGTRPIHDVPDEDDTTDSMAEQDARHEEPFEP